MCRNNAGTFFCIEVYYSIIPSRYYIAHTQQCPAIFLLQHKLVFTENDNSKILYKLTGIRVIPAY